MWIPIIVGGVVVLYFMCKNQGSPTPAAAAPSSAPDNSVGMTSGGAYYQGYLDQINQAVAQYNSSNKTPGTDDTALVKTLNAVMAVAQKDSGWNGHLTTTDMYNLNEAYKAAVAVID
jgi:hypothetical protein